MTHPVCFSLDRKKVGVFAAKRNADEDRLSYLQVHLQQLPDRNVILLFQRKRLEERYDYESDALSVFTFP
jgi:hypothetical protein